MSSSGGSTVLRPRPRLELLVWLCAAAGALALALGAALFQLPFWMLPLLALVLFCGFLVVWNTQAGLCAVAFSIAPLGIVQAEVAGVTVNLPELLILTLFAKEAIVFVLREEAPHRALPWRSIAFYLFASLVGVGTGILRNNGLTNVFQDFRQFNEYLILFLLVLHRVRTRQQIKQILACWVLGALIIAVHGILQRFTGIGIPENQFISDQVHHDGIRSGSFYGATPLGALMVLGIGPALALMLGSRSKVLPLLMALTVAVLVTAAVFTYTRASWLAILVLLLFVFLTIRKSKLMWTAALIGCVAFAAALGPLVAKRLGTLQISKNESSLQQRVDYYRTAYFIFESHPVLGLGWGCFYYSRGILANEKYVERTPPTNMRKEPLKAATVHSAYLQLLVKAGALGLVSFLTILAAWAASVWREMRTPLRDEWDHRLFIGTAAALLGYLFHSTFENFFQWPVMSQIFWLLMGLSFLMAHRIRAQGTIDPPEGEPAA